MWGIGRGRAGGQGGDAAQVWAADSAGAGPWAAQLRAVSLRYGNSQALRGVDLAIPAGVMAGLIGPDGVGKSSLLALIAGVRKRQQGQIWALGADMGDAARRRAMAPRIAYMPQGLGRNLYPSLSVAENLDFFGRLFGQGAAERRARAGMLMQATGLAPFPDRPAGKLSGGMKQKLSLCSALIHDPDLLILDEPTTGVDPLSRRQFWHLIADIRAHHPSMSVLVATAYMDEAEGFDWLAALHDGRVIAQGSPDAIAQAAGLGADKGPGRLERAFAQLLAGRDRAQDAPISVPNSVPNVVPISGPNSALSAAPPAIEARDLTRRFGDFTAVDRVSFTIAQGEIFGFLGSNGCGKSTTMKMLTGLLPPSAGETRLFGESLAAGDMQARLGIGYMSQGFSLYGELTVRQNLALHAKLYRIPADQRAGRIAAMLRDYDLQDQADARPDALPLGQRQRLQLAVAVIHQPRILILDEPTSGVDPLARDQFWHQLMALSRGQGVTIFISTHFMNEAARCDRISLMHAGRVLDMGAPDEITARHGAASLEEAFLAVLETARAEAAGDGQSPAQSPAELPAELPAKPPAQPLTPPLTQPALTTQPAPAWRQAGRRLLALSWRESLELARDPIRLFFALAGPLILLLTMGYGISFDVDRLSLAIHDQDQSAESRALTEAFTAIPQFQQMPDFASAADLAGRMARGETTLALEIPPGFGRALQGGAAGQAQPPEIVLWVDGAMPFRAETARGYALAVLQQAQASRLGAGQAAAFSIETRFLYNQSFRSAHAMVPSIMMMVLMLIPAVMAAISVVREKETGTIANFRATPIGRAEFLIGKQIPYVVLAWAAFWLLFATGRLVFGLPFGGSLGALALASGLYVCAATGFGQLISAFTQSQVSAVFATAVLSIIPTVNFSGLVLPVSSLGAGGRAIGLSFPGAWYQPVAVGSFLKGFGWPEIAPQILALAGFALAYLVLAVLALRKQER